MSFSSLTYIFLPPVYNVWKIFLTSKQNRNRKQKRHGFLAELLSLEKLVMIIISFKWLSLHFLAYIFFHFLTLLHLQHSILSKIVKTKVLHNLMISIVSPRRKLSKKSGETIWWNLKNYVGSQGVRYIVLWFQKQLIILIVISTNWAENLYQ